MKKWVSLWAPVCACAGEGVLAGALMWLAARKGALAPALIWALAALAILLIALSALLIWRNVSRPLEQLSELFRCWPELEREQVAQLGGEIGGAPQATARLALERMGQLQEKLDGIGRDTARQTEREVRLELAQEICASALPAPLQDNLDRFALDGLVEQAHRPSCTFYDYFFLDAGLLAVVVGECPGEDVSSALFMVVAQTAIRSRLRLGRSLEQTMADVNTQLYDLGQGRLLHTLVGTLRTEDGTFSYVDAGGCRPLLMKHDERYEWLEHPVSASLGENEKVSYRAVKLRLRQGDRLFFFTAGLGAVRTRSGTPFEKEQLRAVLNRSRSQEALSGMLRFVADEATVYCQREEDRLGYAALLLEYRKGDKELAHCEVPALPGSALQVTQFLKKQFEENEIQPRHYAKVAVVVDELFALCCRRVREGSAIALECGAAPDGQSVTLRMSAQLGGIDPMNDAQGKVEESAVEFIQDQVDYITFNPGSDRDTLTAVCFWE